MAKMGRPPKPTAQRILEGNPGKRRIPKDEPTYDVRIPAPPQHLRPVARREYFRLADKLLPRGLITDVDRNSLATYAQAYADWVRTSNKIEGRGQFSGDLIETVNGNWIPNPLFPIRNKAMERMNKIASLFGLTPGDRVGIPGSPPPVEPVLAVEADDDPAEFFRVPRSMRSPVSA